MTVGGTTLGNGDYTYNSATGELRIIANNITGNIVIAAEGVACTYTLSVTAPTFADVTYGYTQPDAASITIISTGNSDATISNVTANPEYFIIGDGENTVTAGDSITTWTIQPVSGLGAGEYTDTSSQTDATTESTDTSGTSASSTTSAQTGDETNILLWIVVMLLAVSGITVIGICGRKRKCDR